MDELTIDSSMPVPVAAPPSAPADHTVEVVSFDVDGPADVVDRFVAVGHRLQREVPLRTPMAEATMRHRLSSRFGWYATGSARHFVATVDGCDVGRCSAFVDHAAVGSDGLGLIGLWECENGPNGDAAAHALLDLATAWLREQGQTRVVGPIDFSTWYGYRFRDGDGDGRPPLLTEPVTAAHSIAQWESYGFARDEEYFSAEVADAVESAGRTDHIVAPLLDQGWGLRQLELDEWDELVEQAYELSIVEFARQPYYAPITLDEFRAMYEPMKSGVDPRFVFTAWSPDGKLAGYVFGVRELGAAQRALAAGGLRGKLAAARAAWRTDMVMIKTLCVHSDYRSLGVGLLLTSTVYRVAAATGHPRAANMTMHASNTSRRMSEAGGAVEFRTYVTLARDL